MEGDRGGAEWATVKESSIRCLVCGVEMETPAMFGHYQETGHNWYTEIGKVKRFGGVVAATLRWKDGVEISPDGVTFVKELER